MAGRCPRLGQNAKGLHALGSLFLCGGSKSVGVEKSQKNRLERGIWETTVLTCRTQSLFEVGHGDIMVDTFALLSDSMLGVLSDLLHDNAVMTAQLTGSQTEA